MKHERDIVRLFETNGMTIRSIRRGKHWGVVAGREGSDHVGRFVLSVSPSSDWRASRQLAAEIKRGTGRRT